MDTKLPIIFLHGWGGSSSEWEKNALFFTQRGFPCLAIEIPGFDLPEPPENWGIPEYAEFVAGVIQTKFSDGPYALVGHSFGGRLALYITAHYPELIDKLILTSSAGLNLELPGARAILILLSKSFGWVESKLGSFVLPVTRFVRTALVRVVGSPGYRGASPVMRKVFKRVVNLDLGFCLPKIKCPTLIVWGEKDRTTPLKMAQALKASIGKAHLEIIPQAGHDAHQSHPNQWNEIVLEFLQS